MQPRRTFIRNAALASTAALVPPTFGFSILHPELQPEDTIIGHGGFTYKVDKNWAKISVNANPLQNCHEMVQDSKGRLIMLGDNVHNNILIFDKSGNLLDSWGTAYPGGHGLTLTKEGEEDFLLIVDCGWYQDRTGNWKGQSGQVIKTDLTGRIIFNIGHPRTIGIYKDDEPFKPTETAVAPNGDIYVADGYGSDYIIQYNSKGQYIRHFGGHNNVNKDHNLSNAHGVAVDLRDKNNPMLICTSREENCFKVFSLDGKFIKRIDMPGLYVCRPVMDDTKRRGRKPTRQFRVCYHFGCQQQDGFQPWRQCSSLQKRRTATCTGIKQPRFSSRPRCLRRQRQKSLRLPVERQSFGAH
jgi:hypothetical protein